MRTTVESLAEYIAWTAEVAESWKGSESRLWYRGHADASWELQPGIYRSTEPARKRENELRRDIAFRGAVYLEGAGQPPQNHWEWYFTMQHYGVPTRLLDWSESALVALYFALRERKNADVAAAVWMLDPWYLNSQLTPGAKKALRRVLDPLKDAQAYLPEHPEGTADLPAPPIAIRARHTTRRIAAQRGMFTMHGADERPLNRHDELRSRLVSIEIPPGAVSKIKRQLASAGVTEAIVFPELPGICKEVLDHWRERSGRPT